MRNYLVWLVKIRTERGRDDPEAWDIRSLTAARAKAYRSLSHKGINAKGEYKAQVMQKVWDQNIILGEVHNTASDQRYWYPINGGKYELKSNGKLGKKLR